MAVAVQMRLAWWITGLVLVPMMFVMDMTVFVLQCGVVMEVLMHFAEMQPHAHGHEASCNNQLPSQRFIQQAYRKHGPDKRCRSVIGTRAGGSQVTQREDKEDETDAVSDEAEAGGAGD